MITHIVKIKENFLIKYFLKELLEIPLKRHAKNLATEEM